LEAAGVLVHMSITHPELHACAEHADRALRDAGDDVVLAPITAERSEEVARVGLADVLVILVGGVGELRPDGTVPGEWELTAAREQQLPIVAYGLPADDQQPPRHGRAGYVRARLVHFWERLQHEVGAVPYNQPDDLHVSLLRDVDAVRASLPRRGPDAFRSIYRRLRVHPEAHFDAVAVSMHNMDSLYHVAKISPNSETPSSFLAREPGGAGANTMVALSRLGLSTAVVGAVGDDPVGVDLRTSLEDDGVDVGLLFTINTAESGRSVVIRDDEQNYMNLLSGGANDWLDEVVSRRGHAPRVREVMRRSRFVHYASFSGVAERQLLETLVHELPPEAVLTFKPGTLHAKSGADRLEAIVGRCNVLFVSPEELRMLLDMMPAVSGNDMVGRLDALFQWRGRRGYVSPLIVVVYGVDADAHRLTVAWGAANYEGAVRSDRSLRLPTGGVRDTTGTRDAALAGVLYGLWRGRTPADCANLGYVLAMSAASAYGSREGLPRSTLVRDRWRDLMNELEPPRWLDPYGYAQAGSSTY
jgi:ribokinase